MDLKIGLIAAGIFYLGFKSVIAAFIRRKLTKTQDDLELLPKEKDHDTLMKKLRDDEAEFLKDKENYEKKEKD